MKRLVHLIIALFVAFLFSGCISASLTIGEPEKEKHYYPMPSYPPPAYMMPY